tara:strand:- start:2527 stop:3909 length:1383 start_codon:yes stop_codon:yes gene_type:complete
MDENATTPFEMRLSEVPTMPQPQLELTYSTAIPSNGGTFSANQEVRIPFNVPSECFVDLKRAYLKFNLKNNGSGNPIFLDPSVGGVSVIDNWRVVGGTGALLEEVIHYNNYSAMLRINDNHEKVSSLNHEQDGAGTDSCCIKTHINSGAGATEANIQGIGAVELANNATRTITHRPNSAFFNADRYMPLGYTQGVSYLSITLSADNTAAICGNDAGKAVAYETSNWELHLPILKPGPEFAAMFRSAMGSGVPIQIHSVGVQNTQQTITGGASQSETLTFSTRKRSVKSLMGGIRVNSSLTTAKQNSVSGFVNCAISEYNYSVGGVRIPAQQIKCSATDKGELLANTQLALGYYNSDLRGCDCIADLDTAEPVSVYYRTAANDKLALNSRCLFSLDLESYDAAFAGKNLAGQGLPLVLHAQTGNGANNFGDVGTACLVDLFVVHDIMYILDGATGVITANS